LPAEDPCVGLRIGEDGSLFVRRELLIRLKPGVELKAFQGLLRRISGTVVEGHDGLGIYKIRLPEGTDIPSLLEAIADHPDIARAEPNYAYPVTPPYPFTTRGGIIPDTSPVPSPEGDVRVAVLDTGLNPVVDLEGLVAASLDAINPDEPISDAFGHGTQMALIATGTVKPAGVRKDMKTRTPVISVKAFDDNGFTSNYTIIKGIDFALNNGARVMSLSWGSETRSDFLEDALEYAGSKGLVIVASAGNEPTGKAVYPAAYSGVIAVGALDPDGETWDRSNFGDFVMLYAPGFAGLPVGYKGDPGLYAGTSIAAAFTANLIADILSTNPGATRKEILETLGGQSPRAESIDTP
jgi:thermitase